jgi:hypothetical protein
MGLFTTLKSASAPQTVSELAAPKTADSTLVKRVLRHLAAFNVVAELDGDRYVSTDLSIVLADSENCVGFREVANRYIPIFSQAPLWLREHDYQCPRDARDTVFQKAFDARGESFFDWLQHPQNRHASDEFGRLMRVGVHGAPSWLEVYGVEKLLSEWDGSSALLVDVGGSLGQDVQEFHKRYPDAKGDLVVQDLPATIAQAEQNHATDGIRFQSYDFFQEQPVKGAKIYFMGSILHDWPDEDAKRILKNTAAAMKLNYSTLLLSKLVLPDRDCVHQVSAIDICMMVELAARERTANDWRQLLAKVGLKIIGVHSSLKATRSVIEATLN